tara:strand:+ start:9429 stop:9740 length:312 start_codon:yes stop_codon:yes gene_type:complete
MMIDPTRWSIWRLGGDILVRAYRDHNDNCIVWYPEGITDSGRQTLAVFSVDDEEWTNPIRWIEDTTFEQAKELMQDSIYDHQRTNDAMDALTETLNPLEVNHD